MSDDTRDVTSIHISEDAFPDLGMALHYAALLEVEWAFLLQESRRKTNLADVVDEAAKMHFLLIALSEPAI